MLGRFFILPLQAVVSEIRFAYRGISTIRYISQVEYLAKMTYYSHLRYISIAVFEGLEFLDVTTETQTGSAPLAPGSKPPPSRRSTASWAIRIVLTVLIWLPQPYLFLSVAFGLWAKYLFFGFLGDWIYLIVPAILGIVTALIFVVGKNRKATIALSIILAALLVLFAANCADSSSKFIDPATYDPQAARVFNKEENQQIDLVVGNLAGGLDQYRPFTGDAVAQLDQPATLQFSPAEDLPHVDSATALLPLASSFVTAVYPEEATSVQWDRSLFDLAAYEGYGTGFRLALLEAAGEDASADAYVQERLQEYGNASGLGREGYEMGYELGYADGKRAAEAGVQPISNSDANSDWLNYFDSEKIPSYAYLRPDKAVVDNEATFQYNNSSSGFTELAWGNTDVFFGTMADEEQAELAREVGVEFEYTPIGREGFVFLVNASNPVDSLTVEQGQELVVKSGYARL